MANKILDTMKGKIGTAIGGLKKSSPELLIVYGIVAMGTAVVTGIIRSKKAHEEVAAKEAMYKEKDEEMSKVDKVFTHAKHQVPTIILFATGAAAVIGSHSIQRKRQIALAIALEAAEASAGSLDEKVKKVLADEPLEKNKDKSEGKTGDRVVVPNDEVVLIRDEFTGIEFQSTMREVDAALKDVNASLMTGNAVSVYRFYELLYVSKGLTQQNKMMGWCANDKYGGFMLDVTWNADIRNGKPILTFEYDTDPSTDYLEDGPVL